MLVPHGENVATLTLDDWDKTAKKQFCCTGTHERLIGAARDGDRWLFARQDTVEAMCRIVDPLFGDASPVHPYAQGSWGPKESDRLRTGRVAWHYPTGRARGAPDG